MSVSRRGASRLIRKTSGSNRTRLWIADGPYGAPDNQKGCDQGEERWGGWEGGPKADGMRNVTVTCDKALVVTVCVCFGRTSPRANRQICQNL